MKGRTSMKARLGIATAVVVGGGAIGVAVAAGGHNSGGTNAQSAAFAINQFHHTMSEGTALSTAMSELQWSQGKAMTTLAQMAPMRNFSQVWVGSRRSRTEYAAQRGIVELATKNYLVVKSSNGSLQLWWLKGARFANVSGSTTGMVAMTGSNPAATSAMVNNNMTPAVQAMGGSTNAVNQITAPVTKPITITVSTGTETITITITPSSATVTPPSATPTMSASTMPTMSASATPTMSATTMPTMSASATPTMSASATASASPSATPSVTATKQPVFTRVDGVARGDMVMIAGERVHGQLIAKLVLFEAPTTTTTTPTATPSVSTSVAPTATTTVMPTVAPTTTTTTPAVVPSNLAPTHS
jgi:hypothetical protein